MNIQLTKSEEGSYFEVSNDKQEHLFTVEISPVTFDEIVKDYAANPNMYVAELDRHGTGEESYLIMDRSSMRNPVTAETVNDGGNFGDSYQNNSNSN